MAYKKIVFFEKEEFKMTFEKVRAASMGLGRWANVLADAAQRGDHPTGGTGRYLSCLSKSTRPHRR